HEDAAVNYPGENYRSRARGNKARGVRRRPLVRAVLLQRQKKHSTTAIQVSRHGFGLAARAEINIRALQSADRAAGVLNEHEAGDRTPAGQCARAVDQRNLGLNQRERAPGKQTRIGSDGAAGRDRHLQTAQRLAAWAHAEKNVARIVGKDLVALFGVSVQIAAQALHRHRLAGDFAGIDQEPADAAVGPAVLRREADAQLAAFGQANDAGALNVQKEKLHRIGDPGDFQRAAAKPSLPVDLAPRVIRQKLLALDPAENSLGFRRRAERHHFGRDQIGGARVNRIEKFAAARAAAIEHRLIVAGEQHLGVFRIGARRQKIETRAQLARETFGAIPVGEQGLESFQRSGDLAGAEAARRRADDPVGRQLFQILKAAAQCRPQGLGVEIVAEGLDPREDTLYGIYQGVPLPERSALDPPLLPDKITIFAEPLLEDFPDPEELREEIRLTVLHANPSAASCLVQE